MNVPKYIQNIMERAEFLLGVGDPGYTIQIHKATPYTMDNTINTEAERLVAWARRNGSAAYVNSYVRGTKHFDQTAIVTVYDCVMKNIECFMNYSAKVKYDSSAGDIGDCLEDVYGEVYCPLSKLSEALNNINY